MEYVYAVNLTDQMEQLILMAMSSTISPQSGQDCETDTEDRNRHNECQSLLPPEFQ